jgi:hypothetical protein
MDIIVSLGTLIKFTIEISRSIKLGLYINSDINSDIILICI